MPDSPDPVPPPRPPPGSDQLARQQREARALRENLLRRKLRRPAAPSVPLPPENGSGPETSVSDTD